MGIAGAKFVENGILTELSQVLTVPLVMREVNREANSLSMIHFTFRLMLPIS